MVFSEYNGFNTKVASEAGVGLHPATHVTYMPNTMLTTMKHVKSYSEQAGQEYKVFTNDQQLFKIATQITWYKPDERKIFFLILGGMHTLMSLVGCMGT